MRIQEPLSFSLTQVGRGGHVTCKAAAGQIELAIEMLPGGAFSVWLRGATLATPSQSSRRLRPAERALVLDRLRAWLAANGRADWVIEH